MRRFVPLLLLSALFFCSVLWFVACNGDARDTLPFRLFPATPDAGPAIAPDLSVGPDLQPASDLATAPDAGGDGGNAGDGDTADLAPKG